MGQQHGCLPEVRVRNERRPILPTMLPLAWLTCGAFGWSLPVAEFWPPWSPPETFSVELRTGCCKFCHAPSFWELLLPLHGPHHCFRDLRITLADHAQGVRPRCPISSGSATCCRSHPQPAHPHGQSGECACELAFFLPTGHLLEQGYHLFPDAIIVLLCVVAGKAGRECTQGVVVRGLVLCSNRRTEGLSHEG